MGKDSLAQIAPAGTAVGRPTATARRLVDASVSTNTRRAYAGALGRLDAWLAGLRLDDAALAAYLAELHDAGRAASSAAMAVAAARFRARLATSRRRYCRLAARRTAGAAPAAKAPVRARTWRAAAVGSRRPAVGGRRGRRRR